MSTAVIEADGTRVPTKDFFETGYNQAQVGIEFSQEFSAAVGHHGLIRYAQGYEAGKPDGSAHWLRVWEESGERRRNILRFVH